MEFQIKMTFYIYLLWMSIVKREKHISECLEIDYFWIEYFWMSNKDNVNWKHIVKWRAQEFHWNVHERLSFFS